MGRDDMGRVIYAKAKCLKRQWMVEMGEVYTAVRAVEVAVEREWKRVEVEGDAQCVISAINEQKSRGGYVQVIIDHIRNLARELDSIAFSFCYRQCYEIAHRIAKWAVTNSCNEVWEEGGPC
ncbi:Bifunctional purine biosynthesis protein PurH [Bienertia sinuspersici]